MFHTAVKDATASCKQPISIEILFCPFQVTVKLTYRLSLIFYQFYQLYLIKISAFL